MDRVIDKVITDVCEKYGVDMHTAELIYMDMFKFIRKKVESLDFDNLTTEEDLRNAKVNFNIPRIFKLYTTPNRIFYARTATGEKSSKHDEGIDADNNPKEESGE
jgi:hypothetical protein